MPNQENACRVSVGQPIYPLTGTKSVELELGELAAHRILLTYDTRAKVSATLASGSFTGQSSTLVANASNPAFGELWSSSLHRRLVFQGANNGVGGQAVHASRSGGVWVSFYGIGLNDLTPDVDVADRLLRVNGFWKYIDAESRSVETYDAGGRMLSIEAAAGGVLTLGYSDEGTLPQGAPAPGLLIWAQDEHGRRVGFNYEQPTNTASTPRVVQFSDTTDRVTAFAYDANSNLVEVTWPDSTTRGLVYEHPTLAWALTGVLDERGRRHSSFGYDQEGRAVSTELAGGVNRFEVSYALPPTRFVSETFDLAGQVVWRDHTWTRAEGVLVRLPNDATNTFQSALVQGSARLTARDQPAGSGCMASSTRLVYDNKGNVTESHDVNGHRHCHAYYKDENLERVRVEGLAGRPSGANCSEVTASGFRLPVGALMVSTEWHPKWRLRTRTAQPGKLTTYVYNRQVDPISNGASASCAPTGVVSLCKQVEQASLDADGNQGFGASLHTEVPARITSWTYNQFGQVLTESDPLNNTTIYEYYADTVFTGADPNARGHTKGDLKQVTNAAGQQKKYNKYNKSGQVLEMQDANNVLATYVYDARQRLASISVGGQATVLEYWPTGLLKKVTQPDGSYLSYGYDDAHRLTSVSDNLGNSIAYALDSMGNRKAEEVMDPGNALRRQLTRGIDALGRVELVIGRP